MSWQPLPEIHSNEPITGYVIQYGRVGLDDKMIENVPSGTTSTTMSGLHACAEYSVTVAAVNANGPGPFSNPVVATSGEDSELNKLCTYMYIINYVCILITYA